VKEPEITLNERADRAAAAVLEDLLVAIEDNYAGAIDGRDPEALHDFRVALRRSRAVQRELKAAFPKAQLAGFRSEFRWLQRATSDARDMDVYVHGFDSLRELVPPASRADLQPLLALLIERRRRARCEMEEALRSPRAIRLLAEWGALLQATAESPGHDGPEGSRPIGELAGARIRKLYRRMVRMGRPIGPSSPPESYHELRKQGKELRYMLELFGAPLYPSDVVKPMIKTLKALQDVLGHHQDRHVQVGLLRSLEEQLGDEPAARAAVRTLIASLHEDERGARARFAERCDRFASPEQRKRVQKTFT
jgi:CHAD domain-containing protein